MDAKLKVGQEVVSAYSAMMLARHKARSADAAYWDDPRQDEVEALVDDDSRQGEMEEIELAMELEYKLGELKSAACAADVAFVEACLAWLDSRRPLQAAVASLGGLDTIGRSVVQRNKVIDGLVALLHLQEAAQ